MNIGDLKKILEQLPDDLKVRVSVNYDTCDHIQDLEYVDFFDEIPWITLRGK